MWVDCIEMQFVYWCHCVDLCCPELTSGVSLLILFTGQICRGRTSLQVRVNQTSRTTQHRGTVVVPPWNESVTVDVTLSIWSLQIMSNWRLTDGGPWVELGATELYSDQCKNFPCSLTRNITSHSMKNLAFHSLLEWKMIILPILTTSPLPFSLYTIERMYFLNLGVEGLTRGLYGTLVLPSNHSATLSLVFYVLFPHFPPFILSGEFWTCERNFMDRVTPVSRRNWTTWQ